MDKHWPIAHIKFKWVDVHWCVQHEFPCLLLPPIAYPAQQVLVVRTCTMACTHVRMYVCMHPCRVYVPHSPHVYVHMCTLFVLGHECTYVCMYVPVCLLPLSLKPVDVDNILSLYGVHEKYLNNLVSRFDEKLIDDFFR